MKGMMMGALTISCTSLEECEVVVEVVHMIMRELEYT